MLYAILLVTLSLIPYQDLMFCTIPLFTLSLNPLLVEFFLTLSKHEDPTVLVLDGICPSDLV